MLIAHPLHPCAKTTPSKGLNGKLRINTKFYARAKTMPSKGLNYTVDNVHSLLQDQRILALTNFHMPFSLRTAGNSAGIFSFIYNMPEIASSEISPTGFFKKEDVTRLDDAL